MIKKCINDTAQSLGVKINVVETTFKAIMKVAYDEFLKHKIFNFRIPYCGRIYKHRTKNEYIKSKENNAEIHDSDNNDGTIPKE